MAIDLYCGLGGWTEGLLAEGWDVVGFDIEQHVYGEHRYPAHLVVQDVLTLHGSQFRKASLFVASPSCQEFSYMAMPWKRAKQIARALRGEDEFPDGYTGSRTTAELTRLFDACFRIQREACEAAGRHIPLVVENVRGAIPWVGRSRWNFGSFHLWGDVPALMPPVARRKLNGFRFDGSGRSFQTASVEQTGVKATGTNWSDRELRGQDFTRVAGARAAEGIKVGDAGWRERGPGRQLQDRATKNNGGSWFNIGSPGQKVVAQNPDGRLIHKRNGADHSRHLTNPAEHSGVKNGGDWFGSGDDCSLQRHFSGTKQPGISGTRDNAKGDRWFQDGAARHGSRSNSRKAASATIAKIPMPLARHIGRVFLP